MGKRRRFVSCSKRVVLLQARVYSKLGNNGAAKFVDSVKKMGQVGKSIKFTYTLVSSSAKVVTRTNAWKRRSTADLTDTYLDMGGSTATASSNPVTHRPRASSYLAV